MCYGDFVQNAKSKDIDASLDEIEDLFWNEKIDEPRKYAINIEDTLFGDDVEIWNLSKFTNDQSNIHTTKYYRDVSIFLTWVSGEESNTIIFSKHTHKLSILLPKFPEFLRKFTKKSFLDNFDELSTLFKFCP